MTVRKYLSFNFYTLKCLTRVRVSVYYKIQVAVETRVEIEARDCATTLPDLRKNTENCFKTGSLAIFPTTVYIAVFFAGLYFRQWAYSISQFREKCFRHCRFRPTTPTRAWLFNNEIREKYFRGTVSRNSRK